MIQLRPDADDQQTKQQQCDENGNYLIVSGGDGLDSYVPLETAPSPLSIGSPMGDYPGRIMAPIMVGPGAEYPGPVGVPEHGLTGGGTGAEDNTNHLIIWRM